MQIPNKAFTHGGLFHADDVFSTALLQILNPSLTVERGFAVPQGFDGIVYDIGDGRYDHHMKNSEVRPDGTPYAAFGLLWRDFGLQILGDEKETRRFDEYFVAPLDANDNNGAGNQLANVINAYNPVWDADESGDACFAQAVAVAKDLLSHKLESIKATLRAASVVKEAYAQQKNGIVRLARFAPWKQELIQSKAKFVVFPSQRGGWCAQGVPANFGSPNLKVPFPAEWAGADANDLPAISGIAGLRFCHAGRFLVTTDTEETALEACLAAMEWNKR